MTELKNLIEQRDAWKKAAQQLFTGQHQHTCDSHPDSYWYTPQHKCECGYQAFIEAIEL